LPTSPVSSSGWQLRAALAAAAFSVVLGCSSPTPRSGDRVAVLPFENLTGDASYDWLRNGCAEVVVAQLTGAPRIKPFRVRFLRDALQLKSTHALHGYFGTAAGRLRITIFLEDLRSHKTELTASISGEPAHGVLPLLEALARRLDPAARPFGTRNEEALRAYLQGVEEPLPEPAAAAFRKAIQIDPGFGNAYLAWCWKLLARGDRDGASEVIGRARSAWDRVGTIERAQLELQSAVLQDDPQARARALAQLARLTPADSAVLRNLGDSEARARRFDMAVASYKAALEMSPDDAPLWNQLGYAQAYSGDLGAAAASLKRYQELDPVSANPLDSLGDVHFYAGAFSEAEAYYLQAYEKNPAFAAGATLLKAAFAGLMRGDLQDAEKSFSRYLEALRAAKSPLPELRLAQFEFLTGRRRQAVERMDKVRGADASLRPVACCQLSIWALEEGDLARARDWAGRAGAAAQNQAASELASVCRFLAEPSTPDQLAARAQAAFASSSSKLLGRLALAYALVVHHHFKEAIPVLEELRGKVPMEAPEPLEVLLGWCLLETGRFPEADKHLRTQTVNQYIGEMLFTPLVFPRVFLLRAAAATRSGRSEEAGRYSRLFALYSPGGIPSVDAGIRGASGAGGSAP